MVKLLLCQLEPEVYDPYVVYEGGQPVLYVHLLKAIYGMLHSSLLFYITLSMFLTRKPIDGVGRCRDAITFLRMLKHLAWHKCHLVHPIFPLSVSLLAEWVLIGNPL